MDGLDLAVNRTGCGIAARDTPRRPRISFFEMPCELALTFLSSPSNIGAMGTIEYQTRVLRLTFADRPAYCPELGFRTPKTTIPFNMLGQVQGQKSKMAVLSDKNKRSRGFLRSEAVWISQI